MRPYLAVIYDSWVEAIRSRVLWVLLICWTILLAAIAPFGFVQEASYRVTSADVLDSSAIADQLREAAEKRGSNAQLAVFESLDDRSQKRLKEDQDTQRGRAFTSGEMAKTLNRVLEKPDLYRLEAWPRADRRTELKGLVDRASQELSKSELQQRNRRLVELAFPGLLRAVNGNQTWVGYAGLKIGSELPFSKQQTSKFVESFFLQPFMQLGLGIVAVFVAIVVTSPMVPDMFQAGSLHLLLSKPISRSLLFLSKFLGGCIFVALNIAFLLTGLYLVAGLRLEIWNVGILLCIPVFLFIFMIFYSVSALAGLVWKNAIVAVVVTALFWAVCTGIGLVHGVMKPFVELMPQIVALKPIANALFSVANDGRIQIWDEESNDWQSGYTEMRGDIKVIGPIWLAQQQSMYFGRAWMNGPFGGFQNEDIRLQSVSLPELEGSAQPGPAETQVDSEVISPLDNKPSAEEEKLWSDARVDRVGELPPRTRRVLEWRDTFVVLSDRGLFRFDPLNAKLSQKSSGFSLGFGIRLDLPGRVQTFQQITPAPWQPEPPMDFVFSPSFDEAFVYSHGKLIRLQQSAGANSYVPEPESMDLPWTEDTLALITANEKFVLVSAAKQIPILISRDAWKIHRQLDELGEITPRGLAVSPLDGTLAIVTDTGNVWTISGETQKLSRPQIIGQSKASAIAFDAQGKLWVAHDVRQADRWSLREMVSESSIRPKPRTIDRIFGWFVLPIYWANPKPSAVNETIAYCLKREDSVGRFATDTADLEQAKQKIDPWQPLWSNSIFIVLLLGAGCWYLYRQDL